MAYRLDPPHDRVTLSPRERATFDRLTQELVGIVPPPEATATPEVSRRARALALLLWIPRSAPVALVAGLLLMLLALPSSAGLASLGAGTACVAAAVLVHQKGRRLAARIRRTDRGR